MGSIFLLSCYRKHLSNPLGVLKTVNCALLYKYLTYGDIATNDIKNKQLFSKWFCTDLLAWLRSLACFCVHFL